MARPTTTGFRSRRLLLAALLGCTGTGLLAAAAPASAASPQTDSGDPAALVNVFIGTGNGGKITGNIDTFPGAAVPFGMLTFSPATPSRPAGGDYFHGDHAITGFALTHISGPGCSIAGEVPIMPTVGAIGAQPAAAAAPFSHADESASPGEYQVTLAPGTADAIGVKLAATTRAGIGVFEFPAARHANMLFKVSDAQTTSPTSSVNILGDDEVAGTETSGHFCGAARTSTLYFVAKFNRSFAGYGTWGEAAPDPGSRVATGAHTGAWVSFDTTRGRTVQMKVAISYVSVADARANLKAEEPGWDFDREARQAHDAWNRLLSRIAVGGGTRDQQVQFYTALYHALLHPNVFSDVDGRYIGFDDKVHVLAGSQQSQYANFSGWDIYRSEIPLLALLVPRRVGDMVSSLLNDQAQAGWLPKWGYDNDYTGVMNGDAADPVIAEAHAFGVSNFDAKKALAAMVKGATYTPEPEAWSGTFIERPNLPDYERLGYVPGNASETLEYALADAAIAEFAQALGDEQTARKFLTRAGNWKNTFDPDARFRGYSGYAEPRGVTGAYPAGAGFRVAAKGYGQDGFEEGNTIQYTWMVPQDLAGLIAAMGGDEDANARLDLLFGQLNVGPNEPYYWAGNEPSLGIPWIYDYTGEPWKTQAIVHRLIGEVYSDSPGGEPGNDDLGAMSSWLVWAYLGMYPETPGAPVLVLGAPVFPRAVLHLEDGRTLTVDAPGAGPAGFVRGLTIDGKPWSKDWFSTALLTGAEGANGGTRLAFTLGSKPDRAWGAAKADRPPSSSP